ncbi:cytochrome P450 2U1-like [Antedon mediterranea]|uniref:cytochrome P450 2U1-like n=1 Tax=Antedon mediterranea TaxID=105859 RepID=UPI003AF83CAD
MAKRYGNVMALKLGVFPVVVLSDYESIKEAFVKSGDKFSDRPKILIFEGFNKGRGVIGACHENGQKEQRRFAMSVLRGFGMGKTSFEEKINKEIDIYMDHIKKTYRNNAFDPAHITNTSVSNVLTSVLYGRRFSYDDPLLQEMLRIVNRCVELATNASSMNFLPILKYFPNTTFAEFWKLHVNLKEIQVNILKEHLEDYDPDNLRDFVDIYINEIAKNKDKMTSFDEYNLTCVTTDLFIAGSETTATTLLWAILYMSLYPEVQQKVQNELDKVVGAGNHPTKAHIPQLPYTDAVLLEIQRMGAITPLGVPHAATIDTTFRGYDIKKGTIFIPNMFAVLRDPKVWKNPDVFCPERFLDANNQVTRPEEFIPFCIGRRECLGQQLAKMELYLFFTNIMMNFNITRPENAPAPNLGGKLAATRIPHSFQIIATQR